MKSGEVDAVVEKRRILLFPVQEDPNSERVFRWYVEAFRRPVDELIILTIVEPCLQIGEIHEDELVGASDPLLEVAMMAGRRVVRRFMRWARELNLSCRGLVQLDTSPGPSIVRTAKERGVDAILMGSRGCSQRSEKQNVGNVAEYVLRNCPNISIAIVPGAGIGRRQRSDSLYKQFMENLF
ncbi:unnamed protein product [Mesocestoides corti]|uniref:Usp domain-containing protein n=1 Tax=Mesocestoides corti TaxID=53468 RepID=A0A0R3U8M9_MESCO|nr:unnamed protein product [Mesocestoides corti]